MSQFPDPGLDGPELDEQLLDAILAGQRLPPDAPEQACAVAEMLASLAGPADPGDLAGEQAARVAFARAASLAASPAAAHSSAAALPLDDPSATRPTDTRRLAASRAARLRRSLIPRRVGARLAAALTTGAMVLGGTVAAYAGVLPGPIQNLAHDTIGAPSADRAHAREYQLCTSYVRAEARHDSQALAAAFRQLASAAGGAAGISAYCTAVGVPPATHVVRPASHSATPPASTAHPKYHSSAGGQQQGQGQGQQQGQGQGQQQGQGQGQQQGQGQGQQQCQRHQQGGQVQVQCQRQQQA
jgi:hypothetical protein